MNTAQRVFKNTLSLQMAGVVNQLLAIVAVTYIARILGPGDFGKLSFAFAIVTFLMMISTLGLDISGTREIARDRNRIQCYVDNIIALRLCLSTLSFVLLLLFVVFLPKSSNLKCLIIFYGLGLFSHALLLDWAWQAVERMEYIAVSQIIGQLSYVGLVVVLVKSSRQLLLVPWAQVLASFLTVGLLASLFVRHLGRIRFSVDLPFWKSLLLEAFPLGLSSIMIALMLYSSTVMLGFLRSDEEVGYYNAAYKVVALLVGLVGAYQIAIFPLLSRYYQTAFNSFKRLLLHTSKLMITVAIPLAVGGTILAKPIITLIFGSKYENGIIVFQILVWFAAANYLNMTYARGLWACNRQRTYLAIVSVEAVLTLLFGLILIPPFGAAGAAIGIVAVEVIGLLLDYNQLNKIAQIPYKNHIVKPLLACIPMVLFMLHGLELDLNVFFLIAGGAVTYLLALFLAKGITREELAMIKGTMIPGKLEHQG